MPETQITDHDALFSELSLKIEALETQRNYLLADIRKAIAGLWDVVERASFRGPTAEQVEDAPEGPTVKQIAKILCRGYNHAQRGLRTPAETGPDVDLPCQRCLNWAVDVRDAFNRDVRDKGDGNE